MQSPKKEKHRRCIFSTERVIIHFVKKTFFRLIEAPIGFNPNH